MDLISAKSPANSGGNFLVAVRVRPLIERELRESPKECVSVELVHKAIVIEKHTASHSDEFGINDSDNTGQSSQNYFFDLVFDPSASQQIIYESCAKHIVMSVLEGYNGSIIAYGQTSTGKSYTIEGGHSETTRGIIPRSSEEIFTYIKTKASIRDRFLVRVSLLEIYNERLSDLLDPSRDNLRIREDGVGGVYVDGLSEHVVRSTEEILKLIHNGALLRKTAATKMNVESSRSHAVFTIVVEHASYTSDGGSVITIGKLRLVDLAGSEKIDAEAKYQQQTETKNINLSLHTFGKVVMTLTSSGSSHIPYRDSKLTRILQDSLGGNCKTTMITTITPTASCYMESLNTLKFAKRAKHVKNNAIINKDVSQKALLSAYQEEIKKLREQLNKKGQVIDEEQLMELEKEKKTAQQEKDKVLSELARQKQLYKEAEEQRKQLLKQIENMEKMFLHGGSNEGNEDVIQKAIEEEREKIFSEAEIEYKKKLAQLEEEKKRLADEKEQIEKQKEYFAKMRNDFKPDGATKDDSIPPEKLFQKPQGINRMNHRPPPTGASKPHPPFTHQGNLPIVRRLSQPISRSSLPRPPRSPINLTAPRQPFSGHQYTQSIEDALHRYAEALADPNTGIPSQQHQSGARIFTGSDAAHWFTQNMEGITNIDEAVAVGERLIEVGLVSEIQGGNQFIPKDNVFYQFNDTLTGGSPFSSRPASAMSMLSLPTGVYTISGKQRAGSVPLVSTQLSSSSQLSSVSSLTVFNEEPSSAKELLEYYKLTSTKSTPLHIAAITNDRQKIKELVGPSLSVNVTDSNGNTPLMYAAMAGQSKSCSLLVTQLGADIERKNDDKRSPLMLAVMFEHNNTVKSLLKCGAQISHIDVNKETVFHMAARSSDSKTLDYLFKYSTCIRNEINERNSSIQSPLHVAVLANKPHNISILLKGGADIGACDNDGRTALHYAVQSEGIQSIQVITNNCPNGVNLVDLNGCSALHLACREEKISAVNGLLASQKCDVNLRDKLGHTSLHYGVLNDNPQIVQVLLMNGAKVDVKDNMKMTPLHYSKEKKLKECTELLLKYK